MKRTDGHLPQSFFPQSSREVGINSGEKGTTGSQSKGKVGTTTQKGETASCLWMAWKEVWCEGREKQLGGEDGWVGREQ